MAAQVAWHAQRGMRKGGGDWRQTEQPDDESAGQKNGSQTPVVEVRKV